jgi:glycosyltransferase involved in cell wall biosynthesis
MRIAYIAPYLDNHTMKGGVGGKVRSQIRIWREFNHEARLFALSPDAIDEADADIFQYRSIFRLPVVQSLNRTVSRSLAVMRLMDAVRNYRPDIIYMRFGRYAFPLQRIFAIAPVVFEMNSDDVNESRHLGLPAYWHNRLTRGILLQKASGLVSLSQEIADKPANRKFGKPQRIVANGIDLRSYAPLLRPQNSHPVITMVGSPGMVWHGADKLVRLAERCPDLIVNIVGYESLDSRNHLPSNLHLRGFLDQKGVADILTESDVACGSLALHRNGMQEASPLKSREALAYGIPVILGYRDTDISEIENDRILQLPNAEDNVEKHVEEIHAFAYRMMGRQIEREEIAKYIDQRQKEERRLAFFKEFV